MSDFPGKAFDEWVTREPDRTGPCPLCKQSVNFDIDEEYCPHCKKFYDTGQLVEEWEKEQVIE